MNILKKLLGKFNGLRYPQEYLCLSQEELRMPLHAYLISQHKVAADLTNLHCFVGYCPLLFAVPAELASAQLIRIVFSQQPLLINEQFRTKDAIACLDMVKTREERHPGYSIAFYEGLRGSHRFLPRYNQLAIHLANSWFGRRPGNVFLKGNLYKQVQIAYASGRKISLITVGDGAACNLFPTDLHGCMRDHYIISLRSEGMACRQVLDAGRIVLSDMQAETYKKVYALGKNHMQPLRPASVFHFAGNSALWKLPLPEGASSYRELDLSGSFIHGIHRILIFRIAGEGKVQAGAGTLVHVHNVYASWRRKKGLESNYLMR